MRSSWAWGSLDFQLERADARAALTVCAGDVEGVGPLLQRAGELDLRRPGLGQLGQLPRAVGLLALGDPDADVGQRLRGLELDLDGLAFPGLLDRLRDQRDGQR